MQEPGITQQLQMARHTRLALREDLRKLANRQFPARAQRKEAQTRFLAGRS